MKLVNCPDAECFERLKLLLLKSFSGLHLSMDTAAYTLYGNGPNSITAKYVAQGFVSGWESRAVAVAEKALAGEKDPNPIKWYEVPPGPAKVRIL